MFKKLFGRNQKRARVAMIFDIGTDSVAGSFVHFNPGSHPHVIYTRRSHWHTDGNASFDTMLRSTKYTLANVARSMQEAYPELAKESTIYVTLSAPWFAHETRRAELSRRTFFKVTPKIIENMKAKEMKEFMEESQNAHGGDFVVVEETIIDVSVNGYATDKPVGKKAKHINMSLYLSVAPAEVISVIEDTLGQIFHHKVVFQTSTLVSYVVSRDFFAKEKDYVFFDVGGELTDILVVKNDAIFQTLSFPLGTQYFYGSIAKSLKTTTHEVRSLLAVKEDLHKTVVKKLDTAKEKAYKGYESHLEGALKKLSKEHKLPQDVYLSGYKLFEEDLKNILEGEHYSHFSIFDTKFSVSTINNTDLHRKIRYQRDVPRDLFVALSTLYRSHIS
jgi:hypothetical protein